MNRKVRHCGIVIAAQTACVGVGLWMHHHFCVSSVTTEYNRTVFSRLTASAARTARRCDEAIHAQPAAGGAGVVLSQAAQVQILTANRLPDAGAAVVDDGWRVALTAPDVPDVRDVPADAGDTNTALIRAGDILAWQPKSLEPGQTDDRQGILTASGRTYLAAVAPLGHGSLRVLALEPTEKVNAAIAVLTAPLFNITFLTLVWSCALLGIGVYMILARFHDDIEGERSRTTAESLRQSQALVRTRDAVIFGLAKLADSRDPETGDHLERITAYSTTLAGACRRHPKFAGHVTPGFIRLIGISSALHDIGKVGIEDRILLKPGPLSDAERRAMQKHAAIGGECLAKIECRLGSSNFLQMARQIAFGHHERWDGAGYPHGLRGADIPLAARIVAIADVYDALSSRRVYKEPVPHEQCVEIIRNEAGRQFDPDLVEVWLGIEGQFRRIAQQYASDDEHHARHPGDRPPAGLPPPSLPEVMADDDSETVAALA